MSHDKTDEYRRIGRKLSHTCNKHLQQNRSVVYRSEDTLMPSSGGHPKHCLVDRRQVKGRLARPGPAFVSRGRGRSEPEPGRLAPG